VNAGREAVLGIIGLLYHLPHALKARDTAGTVNRVVAHDQWVLTGLDQKFPLEADLTSVMSENLFTIFRTVVFTYR
jgi:hypothetical protein